MNKRKQEKGEDIKVLQNSALLGWCCQVPVEAGPVHTASAAGESADNGLLSRPPQLPRRLLRQGRTQGTDTTYANIIIGLN